MRVGVHLVNFGLPGGTSAIGPTMAEAGRAAEEAGLDNLSVMDHYFQMEGMGLGDAPAPMLEAYTTLGFLAAHTSTVELQALVTGVTYRHPGLLAKIVTTLDVLSGGRAMLGIGAAWYEREHLGLGVPFPPLSERFERLEETLQIVLQMWSDDDGPYEGAYYHLAETICSPPPLTRPHPPIMIGGSGEQKTLRLVAQYARRVQPLRAAGHRPGRGEGEARRARRVTARTRAPMWRASARRSCGQRRWIRPRLQGLPTSPSR